MNPAIHESLLSWRDSGLPYPVSCARAVGSVEIRRAGYVEYNQRCHRAPMDACRAEWPREWCSNGCLDGMVIVVPEGSPSPNRVEAHEMMHLLSECAYGDADRGHTRASVWGNAPTVRGGRMPAEGLAKERLLRMGLR